MIDFLRRLFGFKEESPVKKLPQEGLIDSYGKPGTNQAYCILPYRMKLAWQTSVTISKFQCHESIKENLENIFKETLDYYGLIRLEQLGLDLFGGCLNIRKKRGSSDLSIHSWGLAVDLDPARNKLNWGRDKAVFALPEYEAFWGIVESNKAYSLGRTKDYDWMHFQFIPF